jgi:hypothetical protein
VHYPTLFNLSDIKVLHFTGEKPWRRVGSPAGRPGRRLSPAQRLARAAADSWDGNDYTAGACALAWRIFIHKELEFDGWCFSRRPQATQTTQVPQHQHVTPLWYRRAATPEAGRHIRWPMVLHRFAPVTAPSCCRGCFSSCMRARHTLVLSAVTRSPPTGRQSTLGRPQNAPPRYSRPASTRRLATDGREPFCRRFIPELAGKTLRFGPLPNIARWSPAAMDECSNHEFGAPLLVRSHDPFALRRSSRHASMLRDFMAWAAFTGTFPEPPKPAATVAEELLLNIWVAPLTRKSSTCRTRLLVKSRPQTSWLTL